MCWVQIIIAIVIAIIGEAIRPKAKSNTGRPAGLGDFQFPTAEAGRVIPWFAGTVKILGPNTTASGLLRSEESYIRVKTGWWTTAKQSYGFRYFLSIQQVYSGGVIDQVVGFQVNDKFLKLSSNTINADYIDVMVDDPAFNGDAKKDGGYYGLIRVYRGTPTQMPDATLQAVLAQDEISAYRYTCHAVFHDFCFGMSNNPPPIIPILSRWPNTLGISGGKHIINETSANVICAVYDLMVDSIRCMKIPSAGIDTPAFLAAAQTCYDEGIGWNGIIDGSRSGKDALDDIMAYADGQVFKDPFTGLWTVKLARGDYDVDSLLVLDESNSRVTAKEKTDWPDTKNTIVVAYVDKTKNWTNQSVQVIDSGNLEVTGQTVNAITQDFNGIDNPDQALRTAERSRTAMSSPFTKLEIEAHGVGATLRINDVFVGKYPKTKRIEKMVLRVTDIKYPNNDETTCNITAVEDKFGVAAVAYVQSGGSTWTPPDFTPVPLAQQRIDEVPWAMTPNLDGKRYVMAMGARADGVTTGYEVWTSIPSSASLTLSAVSDDPTSAGLLAVALDDAGDYSTGTITIDHVIDVSGITSAYQADFEKGKSLLWIGNELVAYRDVTVNSDGTVTFSTIRRSVYDTTPAEHPVGQPVFVVNSGATLIQEQPLASDMTLGARLPTTSGSITLAPSTATLMLLTTANRAALPYPPGRVQINGVWPSTIATMTGNPDIVVTWRHRGKVTLQDSVVSYDDNANYGPDSGTTYDLRVYNAGTNALMYSALGLSGVTTATVPKATFTANVNLRIELTAKVGGLVSASPVVATFAYQI